MKILFLCCLLLLSLKIIATELNGNNKTVKASFQQQHESLSTKLLTTAKTAHTKLQSNQAPTAELTAIIAAKKTVETARLKAAMEFTKNRPR